jgi:hypothetical protein
MLSQVVTVLVVSVFFLQPSSIRKQNLQEI